MRQLQLWLRVNKQRRPWRVIVPERSLLRRLAMVAGLAGVGWLMGGVDAALLAQGTPRTGSAEAVEGMVRTLIDSRLPAAAPASRRPNRPAPPAELREVRANLAGFSQELSQLVAVLYQDVNRNSGLRPLMADALQLSAKATLLARQSVNQDDLGLLGEEFADVDQGWRLLSFRLGELRGLSPPAQQFIQRADQFQQRLTQLLQVDEEVNHTESIRLTTALSTDLMRLMEEVDFEVTNAQQRYDLLVEGRRVYQQSRQLTSVAGEARSLEEVRREYQRFRELWGPFAGKLRPLQLRYVDRQLQRVQEADRALQELLMLPTETDQSELIYLSQLLQRDLDQLMDGVTLRNLTTLSTGRDRIILYTSDFYSACNDFAECVRNGESDDTMAEVYYYLDGNWQRLSGILKNSESTAARQVYRQLDRSISEIRDILAVPPTDDPQELDQVAAALDNLAVHLEHDMRSAIAVQSSNYSAQFRQQCLAAAQEFRTAARQLNGLVVSGERGGRWREAAGRTLQTWNRLVPFIERFMAADRDHMLLIRQQIAPYIVELQTQMTVR